MPDLTPRQLVICALGVALAAYLALGQLRLGAAGRAGSARPVAPIEVRDGAGGRVVVHVAGAVRNPGVYRLAASARIEDAVARAGGATRRADLGGLNLAAKVEDGRQVLVPARVRAGQPAGGASLPGAAKAQPLNLNTATLEQLDELSGVGPATAQKILDHRKEKGGFGSVDELGDIAGIGEKKLAALREEVRV